MGYHQGDNILPLEIFLEPISFMDPTIPIVALICAYYSRKFIYVWPITVIASMVMPFILLLVNNQLFQLLHNVGLKEILQQILIIRLVIASFWALLCWWGANRLRDYIKK